MVAQSEGKFNKGRNKRIGVGCRRRRGHREAKNGLGLQIEYKNPF